MLLLLTPLIQCKIPFLLWVPVMCVVKRLLSRDRPVTKVVILFLVPNLVGSIGLTLTLVSLSLCFAL